MVGILLTAAALTAVPLSDVTVQGAVGAKMDRLLTERVFSSHAQGKVFDEAVEAFRTKWDDTHRPGFGFWQGEYWGKTMLGYTGAYRYTRDPTLRRFIEEKALGLIREFQRPDGYLGTYADPYFIGAKPPQKPWTVWTCNLWNRKYTIWALTEAAEVTGNAEILRGAERAMEHWIASLRHEKMSVRQSGAFCGFMSMSILQPLLVLAQDTHNAAFLAFADELVSEWRLEGPIEETLPNLLSNAFNDRPVHTWAPNSKIWAKAYEMTHCLEGLTAYARARNDGRVLEAVRRLAAKLERDEMNPMWSVGHFDHFTHAAARQSGMSEPCDVVHWLRLNRALFLATGDKHYLDLMEKAFYNAFLAGTYRDGKWVSHIVRSHGTRHLAAPPQTGMLYHQCCVDNQPRGFYAFAETICTVGEDGVVQLNFLSDASVSVGDFKIQVRGNYPVSDVLTLYTDTPKPRPLKVRLPDTVRSISANGKVLPADGGWVTLDLKGEQATVLRLDMDVRLMDAPFGADYDSSNRYEADLADWTPAVFEQLDRTPEMKGLARMVPGARLMRGPLVLAKCRAVGTTRAETLDFASVDRKGWSCVLEPMFCDRTWGAWKATFTKGSETFSVSVGDYQSAADVDDATNWFSVFF